MTNCLVRTRLAFVVYRASEAYLNYIEASYLKNGNIDATAINTGKRFVPVQV